MIKWLKNKIKKKKKKLKKKVVNRKPEKQQQLFSQKELAEIFGVDPIQMSSFYLIRGIKKDTKLSREEAYELFNNIG